MLGEIVCTVRHRRASWARLAPGASPGHGMVFCAGCALWLLVHPYWGIWHDARVYTLMALHWLHPEAFARDPWFLFGSQDSYSLFSPLYAGLIQLLGIEEAARWGALLQGVLFVCCSWRFTRALPLGRGNHLAYLMLVGVHWVYCVNDYHMLHNLRLSEAFVTSRNIAIALSMLAMAEALNGHRLSPVLWSLAAGVLHPLIAFWSFALLVVRRLKMPVASCLVLCLLGVYLVYGLAWLDVPPLGHMAQEWQALVRANAAIVFPDMQTDRLKEYLLGYALLCCAGRFGAKQLRSWYLQVCILAASATALFWLCSLHAPSALIMQLQLWRANWLAVVFVVVALVDLAGQVKRGSTSLRLLLLPAAMLALVAPWGGIAYLVGISFCAAPCLHWSGFLLRWSQRFSRLFWLGAGLVLLLLVGVVLAVFLVQYWELIGSLLQGNFDARARLWLPRMPLTLDCLRGLAYTGGFGLVPALVWGMLGTRFRRPLALGLVLLAATVLPSWWRQPPKFFRESMTAGVAFDAEYRKYPKFEALLTPGETVYWRQHPLAVYFSLQTASYVNGTSIIGIVFSEERSKEVERRFYRMSLAGADEHVLNSSLSLREKAVAANMTQNAQYFVPNQLYTYQPTSLSMQGLHYICADPELDWVIDDVNYADLVSAREVDMGHGDHAWYLYSCATVRRFNQR